MSDTTPWLTGESPEPTKKSRKWLLVPAAVFTALVILTGLVIVGVATGRISRDNSASAEGTTATTSKPSGHELTGSIEVNDDTYKTRTDGGYCSGSDISSGYSDIGPGSNVIVSDGSGKILASGSLGTGTWMSEYSILHHCKVTFDIFGIPDADFYSVEISHRGRQVYSKAQMETNNWTLALSLG